jgi:group I intron endonuclease
MQRSFDKHDVFEFTIVECCVTDELLTREQLLLDAHFNNPLCVNLAPTAGSSLGVKHSANTRAKMSAAGRGRTFSSEHRAKISAAQVGRKHPPEVRAKMVAAWKTRAPDSEETRAKKRAASLGRKHSAESRAKMSAPKSPETRARMKAAWARRRAANECCQLRLFNLS